MNGSSDRVGLSVDFFSDQSAWFQHVEAVSTGSNEGSG